MILKDYFDYVLKNYLLDENAVFSSDKEYYKIIVNRIPDEIRKTINNDKFKVSGSCGKGSKSKSPYIAIMDKSITTSTQIGLYVDFVFKSDMSGFYLAIDQGLSHFRDMYGNSKANEKALQASDYFRSIISNYYDFNVNQQFNNSKSGSLEEGYESTRILFKFYPKNSFSDQMLENDLKNIMNIYLELIDIIGDTTYEEIIQNALNEQSFNKEVINGLIASYKKDIDLYIKEELYKWEAIKIFKENWDITISDENFSEMIKKSLKGAGNILTAFNYYPSGMIVNFSEYEPKTVKDMFYTLFDESKDLYSRIKYFVDNSEVLLKKYFPKGKNHYQEMHVISTYLTFMYPEKYYMYKASIDKKALKKIGIEIKDSDKIKELLNYFDACEKIREELVTDKELLDVVNSRLNDDCFKDDDNHILVWDFLYYIGSMYLKKEEVEKDIVNIWTYSPGEGASEWDYCYKNNKMVLGWDELGDLNSYKNRTEIENATKRLYEADNPYNAISAIYDFKNSIKPGDIIIAKQGMSILLGYGIVKDNEYYFDDRRNQYKNIRNVEWKTRGEWKVPDNLKMAPKTLTNITSPTYENFGEKLLKIIKGEDLMINEWIIPANPNYYDHVSSFNKNGFIDWRQYVNYSIGETVYLFSGSPINRIIAKTVVEKTDLTKEEKLDDSEFYIDDSLDESYNRFVRLRLVEFLDDERLSKSELMKHGLWGNVQSAARLNDSLSHYINSVINNEKEDFDSTNIIFYGGPGCGKSKLVEDLYCKEGNYIRTTFYPDYTNSDFIGQLVPKYDSSINKLTYEIKPGPFTKALELAFKHPYKNIYLIIEEINRGNAAAIFGDVFQLLDRVKSNDDSKKVLGESEYEISNNIIEEYLKVKLGVDVENRIKIPSNLSILATMNTSDQNVYTLDSAFKRRWKMIHVTNDFEEKEYDNLIGSMYVPMLNCDITWREFVDRINKAIIEVNTFGINSEDKQLGKYFVYTSDLLENKVEEYDNINDASKSFAEKVLMYIWEDIAKLEPTEWFKDNIRTLDMLLKEYQKNGIKVFNDNIQFKLNPYEDEESNE